MEQSNYYNNGQDSQVQFKQPQNSQQQNNINQSNSQMNQSNQSKSHDQSNQSQLQNDNQDDDQQNNEQDNDYDDDDDLAIFQQQKRIQIIKQNNLNSAIYDNQDQNQDMSMNKRNSQQSFNKFYGSQQQQMQGQISNKQKLNKKQSKPQINQKQLQAKKLRAFNAKLYFQKVKLVYLKEMSKRSLQLDQISNKTNPLYHVYEQQFNSFLSLLQPSLIRKIHQLSNKNAYSIRYNQVLNLMRKIFTQDNIYDFNQLIAHQYKAKQPQQNQSYNVLNKTQLIFKLSLLLKCQIRKIQFFDIHNFVDQSFYNLDYQKNQRKSKKYKKPTLKFQDQVKNTIQRKILQQQLDDSNQSFVNLNDFSFDSISSNMNKSQSQLDSQFKENKKRSKKNQQIKKYFIDQTYQIYSFQRQQWIMFVSLEDHFEQLEIQWFRNYVLTGLPIISFASLEVLKPLVQFQQLIQLRKMGNVVIRDMSVYFCDNWKKLLVRRKRVGAKPLVAKIFRFADYSQGLDLLQPAQKSQFQHTIQQLRTKLIQNQIPNTKQQLNLSQHFITPSRVGKYHILSTQAKPIKKQNQDIQFLQQKVYWKDDLVPVCSRMGWIDYQRMVRQGQQPLKKTQNRNKKPIDLFRYEQTIPYLLPMDPDGNFILDPQHNSIYVPPRLKIPQQTCIITQKVHFVCSKFKLRFAKLVQGFVHSGAMRILPNQIGYIIYEKDRQFILEKHRQRQQMLSRTKQTRYDQKLQKMWKQVLKYVKLVDKMGGELKN